MRAPSTTAFSLAAALCCATACSSVSGSPARDFVSIDASLIALTHARVIDGTGAPGRADQTVLIKDGTIQEVGDSSRVRIPEQARVLDLSGRTVLPGLVMLHEHMFYTPDGGGYVSTPSSAAPLYLAGGATTIRTGGSLAWDDDLAVRNAIRAGKMAGPEIDLTAPYINRSALPFLEFRSPFERGRRLAAKWAGQGATSFKVYEHLTREELRGVIEEAHGRGLKVTGHLCAVTFSEAADLGIDNLEHGIIVASDFVADKQPDACPKDRVLRAVLDADWTQIQGLIQKLVARDVAITSTLPVFETALPKREPAVDLALELMDPSSRARYERNRAKIDAEPREEWKALVEREMAFERAFVKAGGLLVAGTDPTGSGGIVAGFSNHRAIQLLVEGGFTAAEAIQIATLNGARYLGRDDRIGAVRRGRQADLVVVRGDPEDRISAIEEVETVFKNGVGYDPARLRESTRGMVGAR